MAHRSITRSITWKSETLCLSVSLPLCLSVCPLSVSIYLYRMLRLDMAVVLSSGSASESETLVRLRFYHPIAVKLTLNMEALMPGDWQCKRWKVLSFYTMRSSCPFGLVLGTGIRNPQRFVSDCVVVFWYNRSDLVPSEVTKECSGWFKTSSTMVL